MSIIEALKKIEREKLTSFHVPGHKNGRLLEGLPYGNAIGSYDTTEIPGTDNLHAPEGALLEAESRISDFYGSKESHLLVNGTTSGIISMIYGAFQPGDKVIISRDAHKSVFTGVILAHLEPIYIMPEVDEALGMTLGVTRSTIEEAYSLHEDIKGVVLTYPNYHGICTDLQSISVLVHERGGVLLVDGAHAAHFNLSKTLPTTAIEGGADVVVHSTHKSLPAFTQSSLIHRCTDRVSAARLRMALAMFQSSSPSYLLMASLENAVMVAQSEGERRMMHLLVLLESYSQIIEKNTVFKILKAAHLPQGFFLDRTKLTLLMGDSALTGGALETRLREKYGLQCEYGTDSMVLFIMSIATTEEDLLRLYEALYAISQEISVEKKREDGVKHYDFKRFQQTTGIKPSEAVYRDRILVDLKDAIGSCAGDFIVPYPPGVPILVPGEVISEQVVNYIEDGHRKGYNINGVFKNEKLQVNIIRG
ncbi:MAG: aminotransferase class V-fold PLP-dependent enzyme [Clostridia bacterium]|nr:aminotransferase class V-fold PLP-dependent enzyme [Clostridia bacterium]